MQVLTTAATVERRVPPLYSLSFMRQSVIEPTKPNKVVFDAKYSFIGEYANMVDPRTLDNLIDFIDLYIKEGYDMNNVKELYPIFDKLNKEVGSFTRIACTFLFDTVKERVQHLSKDAVEKLVDHVCISYLRSL